MSGLWAQSLRESNSSFQEPSWSSRIGEAASGFHLFVSRVCPHMHTDVFGERRVPKLSSLAVKQS